METQTPSAQVTPPPTFGSSAPDAAQAPTPTPTAPEGTPQAQPEVPPKSEPVVPSEPKVVPEKYDLKLPEETYLDQKALERIESYAKTNKLSQGEASEFLAKQDAEVRAVMEEKKAMWLEETRADREIGGANLQQNVDTAKRFLDQHMSQELRQDLNRTGYGNNKHFLRFVLDMAKRSANDQAVMPGQQGSPASARSTADLFYAETTSKGKY